MEQNDKDTLVNTHISTSDEQHEAEHPSNESTQPPEKKENKVYKEITEWLKAIVFAVVLVFILKTFLFSPFLVLGDSMEPNFQENERVIVNLFTYRFSEPEFGDVVVIDIPEENLRYIKRIIGVPGDKVELNGDQLYINGQLVHEPYLEEAIALSKANGETYNGNGDWYNFPNSRVVTDIVPEGHYFVLGDNRPLSADSRSIGFRKKEDIIGRVDVIMWPLNKISLVND